jgi:hypothetical protein
MENNIKRLLFELLFKIYQLELMKMIDLDLIQNQNFAKFLLL